MKNLHLVAAILLWILTLPAVNAFSANKPAYNYLPAAELEKRLKANEPILILDIQVPAEFSEHHIKRAVPTHAYPVQSEEDRGKIEAVLEKVKSSSDPVVIVCPRGGGGATRTVDYLVARGIDPRRLFILEKGQSGWNCAELTEGNR